MAGSTASQTSASTATARAHVVNRLLTTDDAATAPQRHDMSILHLCNSSVGKKHHLDTVDLVLAATFSRKTFFQLVEERLSPGDSWGNTCDVVYAERNEDPCEIHVTSNVLVRIWFTQNSHVASLLASYPRNHEGVSELSGLSDHDSAELLAAMNKLNSMQFRRFFSDTCNRSAPNETDDNKASKPDLNGEYYNSSNGSLTITFDRKIPRFSASEALDLDQRMMHFAQEEGSGLHSEDFQPRRWRMKSAPDRMVYVLPWTGDGDDYGDVERLRTQLGAASIEPSELSTLQISTADLVADYGIDYDAHVFQLKLNGKAPTTGPVESGHADATAKRFPDAEKIFHRIRWDDSVNERDIEIQYVDRHEGIMRKPFADWVVATEEEDFIPLHRIRAFARISDGSVLWDRVKRINRLGQV